MNENQTPTLPTNLNLRRRDLLVSATVTAGALVGATDAMAQPVPAPSFGAPLVELHVPAGILSVEQKSDMIKGITEVVLGAMNQAPDPARRLFVEILETAEGGYGVNGQAFAPRPK